MKRKNIDVYLHQKLKDREEDVIEAHNIRREQASFIRTLQRERAELMDDIAVKRVVIEELQKQKEELQLKLANFQNNNAELIAKAVLKGMNGMRIQEVTSE